MRPVGNMPPKIGVIIPFFQRQSGVLLPAIRSALSQEVRPAFILVVDDGSPVAARDELGALPPEERQRIRLIEQPNAGPAAARNRGLDHLPAEAEFVAFLDSDDFWEPGHLANALAAFRQGADFYFSRFETFHSAEARTSTAAFDRLPRTSPLPEGHELFRCPDSLLDALLRASPVRTSTVVYRREVARDLRFRHDLTIFEDIFFWCEIAGRTDSVIFSTECEVQCGRGVNIAASVVWDSPRALGYLLAESRLHRLIARRFLLSPEQLHWQNRYRARIRSSFAPSLLHLLFHRKPIHWPTVVAFARAEPEVLPRLLQVGCCQAIHLLRSRLEL